MHSVITIVADGLRFLVFDSFFYFERSTKARTKFYSTINQYLLTSVSNRFNPSTSSSPAFSSPPGSLKNVVPNWSSNT